MNLRSELHAHFLDWLRGANGRFAKWDGISMGKYQSSMLSMSCLIGISEADT